MEDKVYIGYYPMTVFLLYKTIEETMWDDVIIERGWVLVTDTN